MHVRSRHLALDREHLERSEAKLREEVESRAATPINAKLELEGKLSEVEVSIGSTRQTEQLLLSRA